MNSHALGRASETLAASYLQARGYTILALNYRAGPKELDIVARHHDTIVFVEVKARTSSSHGHPLEFITWQKRRELAHAARAWIGQNQAPGCDYRFDAVAVTWSGQSHTIEHVADAWRIR